MKKIILASASPSRKQLLKQIGLIFIVVPSDVDEVVDSRLTPREQVEVFSLQKAQAVAQKYTNALILAADSMVSLDDEIMGKPKDAQDAVRMLQKLSGRCHSFVTGFTLLDAETNNMVMDSIEAKVWFRELTAEEITRYVQRAKPFDKAGAYGRQDLAAIFVEKFEGDYSGALGLSLFQVAKALKQFGVEVL
jgi:septum formation protein